MLHLFMMIKIKSSKDGLSKKMLSNPIIAFFFKSQHGWLLLDFVGSTQYLHKLYLNFFRAR